MSNIIKLNIGGVLYQTTENTLLKYPDSFLASIFYEKHLLPTDENGYYFIDRDGKLFEYILRFLRDGTINLDNTAKNIIDDILDEADYYGIDELASLLGDEDDKDDDYYNIRNVLVVRGIDIKKIEEQFNQHFTENYLTSFANEKSGSFFVNEDKSPPPGFSGFYYTIGPPHHTQPNYNDHLEKYEFLTSVYDKIHKTGQLFDALFTKNLIRTNYKCISEYTVNCSIRFRIYI
uniref:BTB domain-containing protein n=1 Tax=viral metagenome TaxID=1070528 RepID=A0A6C0E8Y5_9ZZZZ